MGRRARRYLFCFGGGVTSGPFMPAGRGVVGSLVVGVGLTILAWALIPNVDKRERHPERNGQ